MHVIKFYCGARMMCSAKRKCLHPSTAWEAQDVHAFSTSSILVSRAEKH